MDVDNEYLLETARIGLRPFRESDAQVLTDVFADPYAARFYPNMSVLANATKWVAHNRERYVTDGFGLWAACLKKTSELIGDCGPTYQSVKKQREVEVGYHFQATARGQGFGTEAALACLAHGFDAHRCERLVSIVHQQNTASKRVAGRIHSHSRRFERQGYRYDLIYTERSDWNALEPTV